MPRVAGTVIALISFFLNSVTLTTPWGVMPDCHHHDCTSSMASPSDVPCTPHTSTALSFRSFIAVTTFVIVQTFPTLSVLFLTCDVFYRIMEDTSELNLSTEKCPRQDILFIQKVTWPVSIHLRLVVIFALFPVIFYGHSVS